MMMQKNKSNLNKPLEILWLRKNFILATTGIITVLAGIYTFNKTPIYEASALLEIGHYNNKKIPLDLANSLAKRLNILFVEIPRNKKDREFEITSISAAKKVTNFIEIKAQAISNRAASEEILDVVNFVRKKHQKILDDVKNRREFEIKNIDTKINNIKNKKLVLLTEKIAIQQINLNNYKLQLGAINENIQNIENINPTLTALKLMEKRDLSGFILDLNLGLIDLRNKKDELETTTINQLLEKKQQVASTLLTHNYKNSQIVGQIITNDYPAKPKKTLIITIAFIAGFILSIFLIFILNAFRDEKDTVAN
jgi:capsular polysaccharide biosynthesis protein